MRVRSPDVAAVSLARPRPERTGDTRLFFSSYIRKNSGGGCLMGVSPAPSFLDEPPKNRRADVFRFFFPFLVCFAVSLTNPVRNDISVYSRCTRCHDAKVGACVG